LPGAVVVRVSYNRTAWILFEKRLTPSGAP
jgi:hypothetical protein